MFAKAGQSQIDCHFLRGYSDIDYTNLGFFEIPQATPKFLLKSRFYTKRVNSGINI